MLDTVQSDNEEVIDELINDSDTEFIASQEIDGVNEPDNISILTPEANVHVASTTVAKVGKNQSDKKTRESNIKWKNTCAPNIQKQCHLEGEIRHPF